MTIFSALLLSSVALQGDLQPYAEALPGAVVQIPMVPVAGGKVKVGGESVTVKPFYIAKTETVWEAFDVFIASGPPSKAYDQTPFPPDAIARPSKSYILPDLGWGHNGYPAINLSITTVEMFCRWLSAATKKKYRLPTEAEWELACRAGVEGDTKLTAAEADKVAWFQKNSKGVTHPVGKKAANKFGLHDMLGNVGEWVRDKDGKALLCGPTYQDPLEELTPAKRRRYDPKWQDTDPQVPKSRWWLSDGPFVGFRVVCEP